MKKRALMLASLMVLTIMASTRVAEAQEPMTVNIPFDFVAGSTTLPAGEYSVKISGSQCVLFLMDRTDPSRSAILITNAASSMEPQSDSKLIFNRYGNRYFLSQVWTAGYSQGRLLLKSDREKEEATIAKNETKSQVTLVAGLLRTNR